MNIIDLKQLLFTGQSVTAGATSVLTRTINLTEIDSITWRRDDRNGLTATVHLGETIMTFRVHDTNRLADRLGVDTRNIY